MQRLLDGYRRFHSHIFPQKRRLYAKLHEGQNPEFMIITCSDSRVQPLEFTCMDAGDVFMDRSIGNIVPPPGRGEHEAEAVVEYAVVALGVKHIIICGHSQCGAMKALLDPGSTQGMPAVTAWLKNAESTLTAVEKKYGHLEGQALLDAATRENVLVQLENLNKIPCVSERLAAGKLSLHGWVFELEHGQLDAYDPGIDRFIAMPHAYKNRNHHA